MEGLKAVRYWDKGMRNIKVSRNVAFNENEEPRESEVMEVPGLQVEGEDESTTPLQTMSDRPEITQNTSKTPNEPIQIEITPPNKSNT